MYYIARDKDGRLYLYTSNPQKDQFSGEWELRDNKGRSFLINDRLFPEVKWEDEKPKKVEPKIK